MFSRVRLLLSISIGLLVLAACGDPVPPETGFEVAVTVVGDGNVTSTPAGIDTADNKTSATFAENAEVVLTAAPIGNATFTNWTGGACDGSADAVCTIADLTADTAVTANFTEDVDPGVDVTYTINVVNGGAANGTVSSSSTLVTDCADSCEDTAPENTTVTLTATVVAGGFAGWTGGDCDDLKSLTCDVTLETGEEAVTANFNDVSTETINLSEAVEELIAGSLANPTDFPAGHNYQLSSDLDVNYDSTHSTQQWLGLRFDFATLPQGASIQSAVIDMVAEANGSDELNVTLSGEALAAPAAFADDPDTTASADASTRATNNGTTATVAWAITDAWTAGSGVQSPDITGIVQEVVSLDGWGGSLVVFVSPEADNTSTVSRRISNPLDDPAAPMTITVEYVALPPVL